MRFALLCLSLVLSASPSMSEEALGVASPDEVARSGILQHILPRFSLKTGIRVVADEAGPMEIAASGPGDPVFQRGGTIYHLRIEDDPRQQRFRDWLLSDIGKRTVEGFQPQDGAPFSASFEVVAAAEIHEVGEKAALGEKLSLTHCGRCHVIGPQNRMNGLGSTPSFSVLRALPDWLDRFQQFYALNPHPAFTQVDGVTPPFDPERPSPIHPLSITLDDLDAILDFVAAVRAADLGAPLQFQ
ncbi:hypothetical protein FGK63_07510 [Ruegeria sediminis]|uniref:Cytochrome c domain-containing protein n=1 Tax=Ruegeria sediminis TaxID=2583820 RepID=A0ABY2X245_9RHOB|nr:hypothetical protein [Ruegeria sediminis]TMV08958.1 hypothetical protein FGK63_07510 [Ruegeria sediminis]